MKSLSFSRGSESRWQVFLSDADRRVMTQRQKRKDCEEASTLEGCWKPPKVRRDEQAFFIRAPGSNTVLPVPRF